MKLKDFKKIVLKFLKEILFGNSKATD